MTTAETVYELVKKLPEDQVKLVMKFVQFLLHEWTLPVVSVSDEPGQSSEQLPWPAFVQSLSGAWSDFPGIDEIRSGQDQDCHRETL
ncbi:MAG: DUF2281 domain-containing protein [Cyanobacteria bacterium P01_H01_bin.26]